MGCFLLGQSPFYLVLEFVSSFYSRSYPSVRKSTDRFGINMSTNIVLKTQTRCYSFDQFFRKCNDRLVVNMMTQNGVTFPDKVVLLLLYTVTAVVTAAA